MRGSALVNLANRPDECCVGDGGDREIEREIEMVKTSSSQL